MQLQVAFATEDHARQALSVIERRHDLYESVDRRRSASEAADLAVVDIRLHPRNQERLLTLVRGLHGFLVRATD